jgi:hypothetical protein
MQGMMKMMDIWMGGAMDTGGPEKAVAGIDVFLSGVGKQK